MELKKIKVKFNTPYERVKDGPEKLPQKSMVETAGYVDVHSQIERLIMAGRQLHVSKFGFDLDHDKDDMDLVFNPTRRKNYDLADASIDAKAIVERIYKRSQKREQKNDAQEANNLDDVGEKKTESKDSKKPTATDSP